MFAIKPQFDSKKVKAILGKHVIIGITIIDYEDNPIEQKQMHGDIIRVNENEGIVVKLNNSWDEYKLPPDFESLKKAPPGEYKFRTTGEIVVNPDYMTSWTIKRPDPKENVD